MIKYLKTNQLDPSVRPWINEAYRHIPLDITNDLRAQAEMSYAEWLNVFRPTITASYANYYGNGFNVSMSVNQYSPRLGSWTGALVSIEKSRVRKLLEGFRKELEENNSWRDIKIAYGTQALKDLVPSNVKEKTIKKWVMKAFAAKFLDSDPNLRFNFQKKLKKLVIESNFSKQEIIESLNGPFYCSTSKEDTLKTETELTLQDFQDALVLSKWELILSVADTNVDITAVLQKNKESRLEVGFTIGHRGNGTRNFEEAYGAYVASFGKWSFLDNLLKRNVTEALVSSKQQLEKKWNIFIEDFWKDQESRKAIMVTKDWANKSTRRFGKKKIEELRKAILTDYAYERTNPDQFNNDILAKIYTNALNLAKVLRLPKEQLAQAVYEKKFTIRGNQRV